jgi:hypothetical protein
MVYRYSWLVGAGASILAFSMLNSLLKPTTEGLPWQVVVGGGLILGVVISWTAAVYRLRPWITVVVHAVLMAIVALRIGAPDTLNVILPTFDAANPALDTFTVLGDQWEQAVRVIQNGVEPVIPLTGIVILVTLVFWIVGALLSWGLSTGHPFVARLPAFIVTLQFATMDRQRTSVFQVAAFVVLALLGILAITRDEETGSGRMYRRAGAAEQKHRLSPGSGVLGIPGTSADRSPSIRSSTSISSSSVHGAFRCSQPTSMARSTRATCISAWSPWTPLRTVVSSRTTLPL